MNRLPPETEGHLSSFLIEIPKGSMVNPGTIDLGECPILVQSADTANEAAQWCHDQTYKKLTELGMAHNEARKVAEKAKAQQLQEFVKEHNAHVESPEQSEARRKARSRWGLN